MSPDRTREREWEYKSLRPSRGETKKEAEDPIDEINELAADGWRFVDTIDYTGGGTKYLVFERPTTGDSDDGGESS
jgi:hypothetical protein